MVDGTPTAIHSVTIGNADKENVYDVSGMLINNSTANVAMAKGVYIKNGKKFIIK
jgi:hypothetical protein